MHQFRFIHFPPRTRSLIRRLDVMTRIKAIDVVPTRVSVRSTARVLASTPVSPPVAVNVRHPRRTPPDGTPVQARVGAPPKRLTNGASRASPAIDDTREAQP